MEHHALEELPQRPQEGARLPALRLLLRRRAEEAAAAHGVVLQVPQRALLLARVPAQGCVAAPRGTRGPRPVAPLAMCGDFDRALARARADWKHRHRLKCSPAPPKKTHCDFCRRSVSQCICGGVAFAKQEAERQRIETYKTTDPTKFVPNKPPAPAVDPERE